MAEREKITVDRKKTLDTPINRGDYVVNRRELSRVHFSDEGSTCYYQEAGREVGEFSEWTDATKAAFLVFKGEKPINQR